MAVAKKAPKAKKVAGAKKTKVPAPSGEKKLVGKVSHYYTDISVAVIDLSDALMNGDKISIEGATTNIQQDVDSMQIEHKAVDSGKKGDSVGMKVADRVRLGDNVYKVA